MCKHVCTLDIAHVSCVLRVMCHVSCVMCHVSCVMCHVMCHVSCAMCDVSCVMSYAPAGVNESYKKRICDLCRKVSIMRCCMSLCISCSMCKAAHMPCDACMWFMCLVVVWYVHVCHISIIPVGVTSYRVKDVIRSACVHVLLLTHVYRMMRCHAT